MPFEQRIITDHGTIGIWRLSDSLEELLNRYRCSDVEKERFDKIIAPRRKKEFLASRILIHELLGKKQEICYHSSGKPYLKNTSQNISISHSADFAAVYISDKNVGIDIEQTSRNIDKVATRFLHLKEKEHISKEKEPQKLSVLYWAAKEAIFKCTKSQGIQFNTQIFVEPFQLLPQGTFKGSLLLSEEKVNFELNYLFFTNNVLVYCVEQQN